MNFADYLHNQTKIIRKRCLIVKENNSIDSAIKWYKMNFAWIFLHVCFIECSTYILGNEYFSSHRNDHQAISVESRDGPQKLVDIPLHHSKRGSTHGIKLLDLVQENGLNSVQDHFGAKFVAAIQRIITDLISNPQTISSLLALIPTFPPAAIIGSFVMVVLSILQSPSFLLFFQNILPEIKSLMDNPKDIIIPKYLSEFNDVDTDSFELVKEGSKFGTKLVDIATKELNLEELNLHKFDSSNHRYPKRKMRSPSMHEKDYKSGRHQKNHDESPTPLMDFQ